MSEQMLGDDPIDAPSTNDQPANPAKVLGREGVDEDIADVAAGADVPDKNDRVEQGDDEFDNTGAGTER